jgi:hypothetical protein
LLIRKIIIDHAHQQYDDVIESMIQTHKGLRALDEARIDVRDFFHNRHIGSFTGWVPFWKGFKMGRVKKNLSFTV